MPLSLLPLPQVRPDVVPFFFSPSPFAAISAANVIDVLPGACVVCIAFDAVVSLLAYVVVGHMVSSVCRLH